jgi:hypothetical protein
MSGSAHMPISRTDTYHNQVGFPFGCSLQDRLSRRSELRQNFRRISQAGIVGNQALQLL